MSGETSERKSRFLPHPAGPGMGERSRGSPAWGGGSMARGALLPALPPPVGLRLPVPPWGWKATSCVSHAESHPVPGTFAKPISRNTMNPALRSLTPLRAKAFPAASRQRRILTLHGEC